MAKRGTATLPLHEGSAPRWLFDRMVDLAGAISEAIIEEYGRAELLRRLADPYWFQAFGCVLGFDWHSSGVTTTTMGALKQALDPAKHGVIVAGGKGGTSRKTPDEIERTALGLSPGRRQELIRSSKLSATVDNACLQDAHTLYHHTMIVTEDGEWCVVQQGMDDSTARRYHWLADDLDDFVEEPHSAICAQAGRSSVLDLTAAQSAEARAVSVDLVKDNPTHLKQYLQPREQRSLFHYAENSTPRATWEVPELDMPRHHELRRSDLSERSIEQLQAAYEVQPDDYEELIEVDGIGPSSVRALALIAELVHDAESSREDPAKYAYAHGGKDGTPRPVDRDAYDRSIEYLQSVLERSNAGRETTQSALERLAELR